jgi:hypothetical protein
MVSRGLLAGSCSKRQVDKDQDDYHERNSCDSHQAGMSDVSRALRFDAGDGSNGSDEGDEEKPSEPTHINH